MLDSIRKIEDSISGIENDIPILKKELLNS